jgi:hypothetical protein
MKKIFTLISMAFVAMSVNAQEIWSAADLDLDLIIATPIDNTNPSIKKVEAVYSEDPGTEAVLAATNTVQNPLKDYVFTGSTASITLKGVSTPNSDASAAEAWQMNGGEETNMALNTDKCTPKFPNYIKPKAGNPAIESVEYFYLNGDGDQVGPRYAEVYWTEGCGQVPARGCYYELTAASAGTIKIGVFVNKGNHATYIVDKATGTHIAASAIDVEFYYQNNTFTFDDNGTTIDMVSGKMADDFIIQHTNGYTQNRPALGYMTFDVEAGKTYYLFNPKSQLGIYGFYFAAGASGIANVKAELESNAPRYNLAGQKVAENYKGVVIQNGRKYMQY